jgi:hypothetical protein
VTLERGLLLAALLVVSGLAGLIWSFVTWASVDFGLLEYPKVMRVLVISITGIAIGLQLGLTSFLSSIMDIPIRRDRAFEAEQKLPELRSRAGLTSRATPEVVDELDGAKSC